METMEAIASRKSVRSYTGIKVDEGQMEKLMEAAQAAPVGMGRYDSVHISVVEDPEVLHEIEVAAAEASGREGAALYSAPTLIVVSAAVIPHAESIAHANGAMIVHNIALAATDMGIGHCCIWGALFALATRSSLLAKIGVPEGMVPVAGIVVGASDEKYAPREIPANRIGVSYVK